MQAFGSDRVRVSGPRVILYARLGKPWTARTPKIGTHAEFPGTAVLWGGDQYFEVVSAAALPAGGVRYVLEPWRDELTMRVTARYDEESEAALAGEFKAAGAQRAQRKLVQLTAILAGHLPAVVQNRLASELGVFPARMTLWSTIPGVALFGACIWAGVSSQMEGVPSAVPLPLFLFAAYMLADSALRFFVAMSQMRGMGSFPGLIIYLLFWLLFRWRWPTLLSPFTVERGDRLFMLAPDAEVAKRDSIALRAPLLTLLSPSEQALLERRIGFDYRKHAYFPAWLMLVFGVLGMGTSFEDARNGSFSAMLSLAVAALLVLEQAMRLLTFRRGPAGSVLAVLVRPFARDLLRPE